MYRLKRRVLVVLLLFGIGTFALALIGITSATSVPIEREASIRFRGLPPNSQPIKIALLSDIHVGNIGMRQNRLIDIVRRVNAVEPDLVLLAGDFVIGEDEEGAAERAKDLSPLSKLRATWGVFAVFGNHDHWTAPGAIRENLAEAGVEVLENNAIRRGPLAIIGIGDRFSGHDDIALSLARAEAIGGLPVIFTHSPDIAPDIPEDFPLLLAGHTHCGQVVLPFVGPIVRYSHWRRLYNPKYQCGQIDDPSLTTFVTAGVGSGAVPIRINAMPDWWLIKLTP